MALEITQREPDTFEEQIVAACTKSDAFLSTYTSIHKLEYFKHFELAELAQWCVEYWEQFKKAPGASLKDMLEERIPVIPAPILPKVSAAVAAALASEVANPDYLLDRTRRTFRLRQAEIVVAKLTKAIDSGDIDGVETALSESDVLELDTYIGVNPFEDRDAVEHAFGDIAEPLFKLPGAIGAKLNRFFKRGSFMVFTGPEKRGKTFLLFWLALLAFRARLNVVVVQAGDLDQDEGIQRLFSGTAGKNIDEEYTGIVYQPVADCLKNQFNTCVIANRACQCGLYKDEAEYNEVIDNGYSKKDIFHMAKAGYTPCTYCRYMQPENWEPSVFYEEVDTGAVLDFGTAWRSGGFTRYVAKGAYFQLCTFANSTISMSGIRNLIHRITRKMGKPPDVIVVDYMEILGDEEGSNVDPRHQDDKKFKTAKRIAQEMKSVLISAAQGRKESHKKGSLDTDDISENKRRLAHVNYMGALNQTPEEKRRGLMRIGSILQRTGFADPMDEVALLQCLERGRAFVDSFSVKVKDGKTRHTGAKNASTGTPQTQSTRPAKT